MTRKQAVKKLTETKKLTTEMLKPLGISFDSFLTFAQLSNEKAAAMTEKLISYCTEREN